MKKTLGSIFCALVFFFGLLFIFSGTARAADISFSWGPDARTIVVSGAANGSLREMGDDGPGYNRFMGDVTSDKCGRMSVLVLLSNPATATLDPSGSIGPPGGPSYCDSIALDVSEGPYTIQGTRSSTDPPETQDDKRVAIDLLSNNKGPGSIIFTLTDSAGKKIDNPSVNKTSSGNYLKVFYLDPGNYKICFSALEPCHNFTKEKHKPLVLTYGNASGDIGFKISVLYLNPNKDQICHTTWYIVDLKQGSKTIKTIKTAEKDTQVDKDNVDLTVFVYGTFKDIPAGQYQVCLPGANRCENVTVNQFGVAGPNPVEIRNIDGLSAHTCKDGSKPGDPQHPPPPAPPCAKPFGPDGKCPGVNSAFGIFNTEPGQFITKIFAIILSLSGGIALLLIIRAGYMFMISQGKPEELQKAREQLIAAIVGLMFMIFSFVILQVIGVDILRIPGFGGAGGSRGGALGSACTISFPDPNNGRGSCASGTCKTNGNCIIGCNGTCQ